MMQIIQLGDEKLKNGLSNKQYILRLGVSMLFLVVAGYINVFSSVVAAYRTPNIRIMNNAGEMTDRRILPDFGHFASDYIQQYMDERTADYWEHIDPNFFISHIIHSFVVLLLIHPQRLMLGRRTCAIVGYIFLSRAICVLSTSMPDSHPQCYGQFGHESGAYKDRPLFPEALIETLRTMSKFSDSVTCGDMIFSGHMVIVILGCLFFGKYCNEKDMSSPLIRALPTCFCTLFRWGVYVLGLLGSLAIIKSRLHYTVDVILATYFSMNSWNVYHRTVKDIFNKTDTTGSRLFEFSPFNGFFAWLESTEMQVQDAFIWDALKRKKETFEEDGDIPLMSNCESDRSV